VEEILGLI